MYSGITSGRVLDGELVYTKILAVNLFAFAMSRWLERNLYETICRQTQTSLWYHTIIRAAFVRLFVPLLVRGPLTDLRQTLWVYVGGPRNCPWGVLFWKAQRVNGSNVTFSEQTTPGWDHTTAKGTASKSLITSTGIINSICKCDCDFFVVFTISLRVKQAAQFISLVGLYLSRSRTTYRCYAHKRIIEEHVTRSVCPGVEQWNGFK